MAGQLLGAGTGGALLVWALLADDHWLERHMTASYCFDSAEQVTRLHVRRVVGAVLGVVILVVVRPRAARWLAPTSLRSFLGSALRILVAVALAVIVADVVLRRHRARSGAPPVTAEFHADVDRNGFRRREPEATWDIEAKTVLFSGESVAFGYGLPHESTIPALVGAHTGLQTVNLAHSASANDEALFRVQRWLPELRRPLAVVTFVPYDWIYRNVALHRSRLALTRSGSLEIVEAEPEILWSSPIWELLRSFYHAEDAVELTRAILRDTAVYVRSRGAYPLFVLTQCGGRCAVFERGGPPIARRLADDQPFTSIEVYMDAGMILANEIHPNARGAQRYAEAVEQALREAGVLVPAELDPKK